MVSVFVISGNFREISSNKKGFKENMALHTRRESDMFTPKGGFSCYVNYQQSRGNMFSFERIVFICCNNWMQLKFDFVNLDFSIFFKTYLKLFIFFNTRDVTGDSCLTHRLRPTKNV